jgi:hypothetical protein
MMSLLLAAIAAYGFAQTVPGDIGAPGFPVLLWVHGGVFLTWVLLFVAQPVLIMRRSFRWHRRLGWFGVGLAVAMVLLGGSAVILALLAHALPPFYPPGLFLVRGVLALAMFAGLMIAAVVLRRRGDWHKRLMLCASILVIVPGLERALPVPSFGPHWWYKVDALVVAIALIGPAFDLVQLRRLHPAYLWGVGAIVLGQVVTDVLAPSGIVAGLVKAMGA